MKIEGSYDETALHILGAGAVLQLLDANGAVIGYETDCDIDMGRYEAALAQVASERANITAPLSDDEIKAIRKLLQGNK